MTGGDTSIHHHEQFLAAYSLFAPAAGIVALFYLRSSPFLLALIPASFWVPQAGATTRAWPYMLSQTSALHFKFCCVRPFGYRGLARDQLPGILQLVAGLTLVMHAACSLYALQV
jgi:hypothetical protein